MRLCVSAYHIMYECTSCIAFTLSSISHQHMCHMSTSKARWRTRYRVIKLSAFVRWHYTSAKAPLHQRANYILPFSVFLHLRTTTFVPAYIQDGRARRVLARAARNTANPQDRVCDSALKWYDFKLSTDTWQHSDDWFVSNYIWREATIGLVELGGLQYECAMFIKMLQILNKYINSIMLTGIDNYSGMQYA